MVGLKTFSCVSYNLVHNP